MIARRGSAAVPLLSILVLALFHLIRLRQRRQRRFQLQLRQFLLRQSLHIPCKSEQLLPTNRDLLLASSPSLLGRSPFLLVALMAAPLTVSALAWVHVYTEGPPVLSLSIGLGAMVRPGADPS